MGGNHSSISFLVWTVVVYKSLSFCLVRWKLLLIYIQCTWITPPFGVSSVCLLMFSISIECFLLMLSGAEVSSFNVSPLIEKSFCMQMHRKGSRHRAAESRFKERELRRQDEIKKRIALSDGSIGSGDTSTSAKQFRFTSKPLIEQTKKAAFETLCNKIPKQNVTIQSHNAKESRDDSSNGPSNCNDNSSFPAMEAGERVVAQHQLDFQAIRERELRFTAAGWKRDCHGRWFKDENVSFFSGHFIHYPMEITQKLRYSSYFYAYSLLAG